MFYLSAEREETGLIMEPEISYPGDESLFYGEAEFLAKCAVLTKSDDKITGIVSEDMYDILMTAY